MSREIHLKLARDIQKMNSDARSKKIARKIERIESPHKKARVLAGIAEIRSDKRFPRIERYIKKYYCGFKYHYTHIYGADFPEWKSICLDEIIIEILGTQCKNKYGRPCISEKMKEHLTENDDEIGAIMYVNKELPQPKAVS